MCTNDNHAICKKNLPNSYGEDNVCAICLENIDDKKNICILDCGHKLHSSCLCINFIFKRYNCPLCKKKIIDDDIIKKQDQTVNNDNETYYITYELHLENKKLRQTQYKNYPILKKMYKEVLNFKKMLKETKKSITLLNKQLIEKNINLINEIKENKKMYKNYYQKYLRRERKYILKANDILNIQEDFSIF
jgi:hypothetical protein